MKTDDEKWMKIALDQARAGYEAGEVPIGAVAVKDGQELSRSCNRIEELNDATAHAELLALQAASRNLGARRLTGVTVYVTLEPCAMCAMAMVLARVDRVVFGAFEPKFGAGGSMYEILSDARLNHRCEVTPGVMADEAGDLMRSFFRNRRAGFLPQKNVCDDMTC